MPSEFYYVSKHVDDWTEAELAHASQHLTVINKSLHPIVELRLKVIETNKRLVEERTQAVKRERKLLSRFLKPDSTKSANFADITSVKQSLQDATTKKGGGHAVTFATVVGAYEWLSNHPEILGILPKPSPIIVWILCLLGGGWWFILFAKRLSEKWSEQHG